MLAHLYGRAADHNRQILGAGDRFWVTCLVVATRAVAVMGLVLAEDTEPVPRYPA